MGGIKEFDKCSTGIIRKEFTVALLAISKRYGVSFDVGTMNYSEGELDVKVRGYLDVEDKHGNTLSPEEIEGRKDWGIYAYKKGYNLDLLDKEISTPSGQCIVRGYSRRKHKYCILVKRKDTGKLDNITLEDLEVGARENT